MRALVLLLAALPLLGITTTVETVGGTRAAIVVPDTAPAASVILIPGKTTLLRIADDGSPNSANFLMLVRELFVDDGFAVGYVDDPGNIGPMIARMRRVARPVFLIGTSNGSAVAARAAAALGPDGPDGLVLTSTVTETSRNFAYSASDVNFHHITMPVLFVHNTNDVCSVSPPSGIARLIAQLPAGTDVRRIDVSSAPTGSGDQCGPDSPHGYVGIEAQVVSAIEGWMRAHGAQGTP